MFTNSMKSLNLNRKELKPRIFGLCNNFAYVIMLSAAEDILKQDHRNTADTETKCFVNFKFFFENVLLLIDN